ncbi:YtjB family periplasmic protein [Shewanella sp. GXUN23E]|uniref:YtjB family periplasmic protein n=1 Tax=Shewanella sp. GXUN23E TaxID=3422498 RepID=UPI003D7E60E2
MIQDAQRIIYHGSIQANSIHGTPVFFLRGLKKSHKFFRLLQLAIAVALIIALVQLWKTSLVQGQELLESQTEKMARLMVQQTAYSAAPALQLQNDEQLQWLTEALVEDPKVMAATIFSAEGQRLSFAQSLSEQELEPGSEELTELLAPYPPYVEAVYQGDTNLGYVEVYLAPQLFFNEIKTAHQMNMEQQQLMLLIAGLIGFLLCRTFSYKRADFDRRKARANRIKQSAQTESARSDADISDTESSDTKSSDTDIADTDSADKPHRQSTD